MRHMPIVPYNSFKHKPNHRLRLTSGPCQAVGILKNNPTFLHKKELAFFREYLTAFGATIPSLAEMEQAEADRLAAAGSGAKSHAAADAAGWRHFFTLAQHHPRTRTHGHAPLMLCSLFAQIAHATHAGVSEYGELRLGLRAA
jgi:hypothetical protein